MRFTEVKIYIFASFLFVIFNIAKLKDSCTVKYTFRFYPPTKSNITLRQESPLGVTVKQGSNKED